MWDIIYFINAFTCNNQCPDLGDVALAKARSRVCVVSLHRESTCDVQKYIFGTQIYVRLEQKLFYNTNKTNYTFLAEQQVICATYFLCLFSEREYQVYKQIRTQFEVHT